MTGRLRRTGTVLGIVVTAGALVGALGACGAGREAPTAVQVTSTGGTEGAVGPLQVRHAMVVFDGPVPGDTVYEPGQDVPLQLTILNTGREAERLVAVRSPVATSFRIDGDATIPGGQELVAGYDEPVASITLPGETEVGIALVGLTEPIRSGLTYPVELVFERAGVLLMTVPVEIPSEIPPPRARTGEFELNGNVKTGSGT